MSGTWNKVDLGLNWLGYVNANTKISVLGANGSVSASQVLVDIDCGDKAHDFQTGQKIHFKDSVALKDKEYEIYSVDNNRFSVTAKDVDLTPAGLEYIGKELADKGLMVAKSENNGKAKVNGSNFSISYFGDDIDQFQLGEKLKIKNSKLVKDGQYTIIAKSGHEITVLPIDNLGEGEISYLTSDGLAANYGTEVSDPGIMIYTLPQRDTDLNIANLSLASAASVDVPGGFDQVAGAPTDSHDENEHISM